ncbi:ATP-dependent DNA helicase II subunit 1 [Sphaceloma murrayae]|uniref:ATP-dependent DNA helicase II subunit 1 n=1 Tax=Sphaceloma murrayae TaxID=2082308 RepID=A0A2K1QR94_9PEZI|nr:ATP-dependent DNA helicase II subunit 1 [Sphaceloma murrayae]
MADSSRYPGRDGGEEDDEEDVDETGYKTVKDAVLFAIDVSSTMLQNPPKSDSKNADHDQPTVAALKCAYTLMQQRIISNPNDMMGVLLFGTEKSRFQDEDEHSTALSYPHCYLLTDLDVPAAADVKRLKSIVEDEEERADLLQASEAEVSMANVLFCANQIFTTKAPNFSSRRLFIVTDNDNPHATDKTLRSAAAVRAKDLYDLGVVIELFPISQPDHVFDRSIFYDDIIYSMLPTDPDAPAPLTKAAKASASGDGISLLQSLLSEVRSKAAARRAQFSNLPFEIGPGMKISVKGFIIFKRQEPVRTSYVYIGGEKAQIATGVSSYMAEDTARSVEKVEIRKAYKFGGETITFTEDEIKTIRNFGDPVLRIIGFKPTKLLPSWANYRPSTFIYPSEEEFVGSSRVFAALQQKLLKSNKMGVAWFIPRRNAVPTLAAILPGEEELDEEGMQKMPPGLWIHPLPFADDVRSPPDVQVIRATDNLIDSMRVIVQQLQLPKGVYDASRYPNPSLQWFYKILQALALEEDVPEKAEDKTVPRYRQIDKRAGGHVLEWGTALEAQYKVAQREIGEPTDSGATKRGAGTNGAAAKKSKTADGGFKASTSDSIGDDEMRKHFQKNSIGKLTVADLKAWMGTKGLKAAGKKQDLVDQVQSYFETKMETD